MDLFILGGPSHGERSIISIIKDISIWLGELVIVFSCAQIENPLHIQRKFIWSQISDLYGQMQQQWWEQSEKRKSQQKEEQGAQKGRKIGKH